MTRVVKFEAIDSDDFDEQANTETVTQVYKVWTDDVEGAKGAIADHRPDLLLDAVHARFPGLRVTNRRARQVSGIWDESTGRTKGVYELSVTWSTKQAAAAEAPYDLAARHSVSSAETMKPIWRDLNGEEVVNTAGQRLELEAPQPGWIIQVEKNFVETPTVLLSLAGAVNKEAVTLAGLKWPKKTLRCRGLRVGDIQKANPPFEDYRAISFEFEFNPNGWDKEILNMGTVAVPPLPVNNGGPQTAIPDLRSLPIVDEEGNPVQEPQFLDADGRVIPKDPNTKRIDPSEIITLDFKIRPEIDYRKLPLF